MTSTDLRTRWATMTPRERDALVAEMMGMELLPRDPSKPHILLHKIPDAKMPKGYWWKAVLHFTTDPAHLLTLLGAIHYQWSVRYDPAGWGTFTVHADTPSEDDDGFVDHAARFETVSELPAAVALAALLSRAAD